MEGIQKSIRQIWKIKKPNRCITGVSEEMGIKKAELRTSKIDKRHHPQHIQKGLKTQDKHKEHHD